MLTKSTHFKYFFLITLTVLVSFSYDLSAQNITRTTGTVDSLSRGGSAPIYRWKDSYLNAFTYDLSKSPFLKLNVDSLITKVFYQPQSENINVEEKLGGRFDHKLPQAMTFNEYSSLQNVAVRKSILRDYERMQDGNSNTSGRGLKPMLKKNPIVDRIFGGKAPEFKPNGFISADVRFGTAFNANPQLPVQQWRQPIFDFDQQISVNFNSLFNNNNGDGFNGNTGNPNQGNSMEDLNKLGRTLGGIMGAGQQAREKVNILGNIDTKSAFSFENQFKLNFRNEPEDILQSIELGNVSFPLRSQLIPGVDKLMGLKAGLRFGKLDITTVLAQQTSRTESIFINGGNQSRPFEIRCDTYDENKHFFLSHFFRDQYEANLKNLPMVTSQALITRVEVYVTNRSRDVGSMRNLVGLADLGEDQPFSQNVTGLSFENGVADNRANSLGDLLKSEDVGFRRIDNTNISLESQGLSKGIDFEILRGAKRLSDREFQFHPQLGYISLLTPLRNDEILAVAYEYIYGGKNYRVGELTEDYSIRAEEEVVALKMLKSSTIRNQLENPMWDLMMKNIYSLSQGQIEREGFQLRIVYKDDATGLDSPNLPEAEVNEIPLIELLGLDKLNYNNDRQRDGNFDYVQNVTINEIQGTMIFPQLEPFGSYLDGILPNDQLKTKYVFQELYDRTLTDAQQVNAKNKFFILGSVQSSSKDIPLPLGASGGAVRVYSGGSQLQEGVDYQVDTQIGRIRLINPSILASGRTIRIDFERPDLFQTQIRRLFGVRFDYTVSPALRVGGTYMDLRENTPGFLTRTAIGSEPVNNKLWGLDVNFKKEGNGFTRILDKLPLIQTKEPSSILLSAEFAQLIPGVNDRRVNGNAMIDDFEGARTINDLTRQPQRWRLASTPDSFNVRTTPIYGYNYRRAKIAAYSVDVSTYLTGFGQGTTLPRAVSDAANNNLFERGFQIQDIFPGRSRPVLGQNIPTTILDLSYFPQERGMYNYNPDLLSNGLLKEPKSNFGAVMRGITFDADFDNANVEYLEFWMLNPFPPGEDENSSRHLVRDGIFNKANITGGKLLFHLGDISEDVVPDSRFNFENGIPPFDSTGRQADSTSWGTAPRTQFVTDAFDNAVNARDEQDVGLEGLKNSREREFPHIRSFLDNIQVDAIARGEIEEDPSADDFKFFLDPSFGDDDFIVKRYKNYLGMEKNSPVITETQNIAAAGQVQADKEDINEDNTINDVESYHEFEIPLKPGDLEVGNGYIVDKVIGTGQAEWFLFRIPLRQVDGESNPGYKRFGGITGFKSIRFMRMVMTDWEQPVVLRFAALQLVANSYRTYLQDLNSNSIIDVPQSEGTEFNVTTVSVEENGCTEEGDCNVKEGQVPYVVPPGFIRDRDLTQQIFQQFNEQSVSLAVENLRDGDKRGIFKNTQLDLNMYKRIKMFVHMQNPQETDMGGAFIRFGTDLRTNYYEVEIPRLKATTLNNGASGDPEQIWPEENEFDFALDDLRNLKISRNRDLGQEEVGLDKPYTKELTITGLNYLDQVVERTYRFTVVGNPDFSNTLVWMVGASNPKSDSDIGSPETFTIWVNELRANGFDQTKGESGIISADIKIADIGNVSISGNMNTFGFGGVQSGISARSRETAQGFGIASTLELDKFMPEKWGWSIPLFMNYDQQTITPHFNPLDPDIVLERALEQFETDAEKQTYRDYMIDRTVNKGFNLANVRKIKTDPAAKAHLYDIENFSFSYAQNSLTRRNVLLKEFRSEQQRGALAYEFSPKQTLWEPFKSNSKLEKPTWKWLKDFNFSPIPNLFAFRTDFDRNFIKTEYRSADLEVGVDPNYIQYFNTNRFYDMQWDFTKSINFNYSAQMRSLIDENPGERDAANREKVWQNLSSFGRANYFKQSIQATYAIPLEKFFLLDWVKSDARFNADYIFRANAFDFNNERYIQDNEDKEFGNFIENSREYAFQGQIDLVKLYNKLKYLRFANSPDAPKERFTRAPGVEEEVTLPTSDLLKKFTRLLMTVRGVNFNFIRTESTILPGFLETPNLLGLASGSRAPGLGFAMFGSQNADLGQFAGNGWLSESRVRNDPFTQNRQTKFDFSTNLEPWTGFRMQIRGNYARGDSYQQIYKPNEAGTFGAENPFRTGTFSMSFWSFKTVFKKMENNPETNYRYEVFENMKTNREEVIRRIYAQRNGVDYNSIANSPISELSGSNLDPNSQDVLIPAFFAAYSGNTVENLFDKVGKRGQETFNPFLRFPMPNWRIDYGGLEKLPAFKKIFSSLTLSHSYSSTYSVGNFTSSLLYGAAGTIPVDFSNNDYRLGNQVNPFISNSGAFDVFLPVFIMSAITMEERYSPLLGVQFTLLNKISGRLQYNKERRASLNLSNTQVAEQNSDDWIFGFGFKKAGIKLPFRGRDGNLVVLKNDVNFRFDLTYRDQRLLQRRLDYQYANSAADGTFGEVIPIQGNTNFQLRPQVQYQFNKKLSMSFYIEHFTNTPFTSITFARSQTVGGINMRFNLAD